LTFRGGISVVSEGIATFFAGEATASAGTSRFNVSALVIADIKNCLSGFLKTGFVSAVVVMCRNRIILPDLLWC
jgi:hypothetical protein